MYYSVYNRNLFKKNYYVFTVKIDIYLSRLLLYEKVFDWSTYERLLTSPDLTQGVSADVGTHVLTFLKRVLIKMVVCVPGFLGQHLTWGPSYCFHGRPASVGEDAGKDEVCRSQILHRTPESGILGQRCGSADQPQQNGAVRTHTQNAIRDSSPKNIKIIYLPSSHFTPLWLCVSCEECEKPNNIGSH